ncbi:hypothetical protein Holit_03255 [Hollandina sp. SP2]
MVNIDEERENLIKKLSEHYSQNIINMEEYERILEYLNKIETEREINIIKKIIHENNVNGNGSTITRNDEIITPKPKEKHLSIFSWRTTNIKPQNRNGGKYISLFGANRIIVDNLPRGRTVLNVNSIFGLTEIVVSENENIKIINRAIPIFSGIFTPDEKNREDEELPELYITGKVIFGSISVRTIEDIRKEKEFEEAYAEKYKEKMLGKMNDKNIK